MHKSAFNGQPGTKRDVSLALTGGLAHVSHALLLDRPRSLVQDAMGRDHADEIDVAIVVPPTTVTPKPTTTPTKKPTKPVVAKPPAKQKFTPQKKLRLWIAGDSLVITPGYSIVRAAGGSPVIQSVGGIDGHIATGPHAPRRVQLVQRADDPGQGAAPERRRAQLRRQRRPRLHDRPARRGLDRVVREPRVGEGVPPPRRRGDGHGQPGRRGRRLDRPADRTQPDARPRSSTRSTRSSCRRRSCVPAR